MKKSLLVSIVISNYNGEKFIERTINSVLKNTQVSFEIIIVDGGSTDKSTTLLKRKFDQENKIKLIFLKKNVGPAKALNIGASKSLGKHLVILGYDMEVDKNWLIRVVDFLEKNKDIGGGQLKILRMDRRNVFDSAGEKLTKFGFLAERAREAKDKSQFDKTENIFSGKGTAVIFRKKLFLKVGGFDPDYFMYWEEPDLFWRIWKVGYRVVFLPMGKTYHAYATKEKKITVNQVSLATYLGCRNQIATIIKNGVGFQGLKMLTAVISAWIGLLLLFIVKLDFKRTRAVLKAFVWLFKNQLLLLNKRKELKKKLGKRFFKDKKWLVLVEDKRNFNWYLRKAFAYLSNKPY